ncbi:hypothetical protein WICMUC_004551 [Wickerhamomyces mucosus]|uniref:DNA-directed RNA polymerase subunit n=1 Tax=Wickerhamomyces mucosus TaxID=1378264 RepID=A0A9P8T9W9_9ASCO|nr:hypothetical protein WICMUC_004551 [Wickerhamomyces mucosus]
MSEVTRKRSHQSNNDSNIASFKKRKQFSQQSSSNPKNSKGLSECFHKIKTSLYVSLAPIYLNTPIEGIKSQHLDPLIMKFFPKLNGVIISYSNLKLCNESTQEDENENSNLLISKINPHSPFTFLWINVEFLIWKPLVGDNIEGLIYIQSPSHIGLLINDTFNASIKKSQIPLNWKFNANEIDSNDDENNQIEDDNGSNHRQLGQWVDENNLPIDGKLKIIVKAIHTSGRIVSIEGSLITPGNEADSKPVVPNLNKKIKFNDDDNNSINTNTNIIPVLNNFNDNDNDEEEDSIPVYENNDSSDNEDNDKVIAENESSEDEVESD